MKKGAGIEELYLRGLEALLDERFEDALEELERVREWGAKDPVMLNDLALARMAVGQSEGAISLLSELMDDQTPHPFVHINNYYCRRVLEISALKGPPLGARIKKLIRRDDMLWPRVSVIMATYNRPQLIRESLESVLSQTFKDFELVVVNDGGDEAVKDTLAEYPDKRVVYVSAEHHGLSSALNIGLGQARGEWIAYLDDDDVYYPDHLETLCRFLESRADAKAAYTDMYRAFQTRYGDSYRVVKRVLDYGKDMDPSKLRSQSQIPNRNPLIHHRRCVDEIGGYHEGLKYTMDWDFQLRLSRRYDIWHIRKITGEFRTRYDESQMTTTKGVERNYCRNLILYLNNISPLTGRLLRSPGQGDGKKLVKELDRILRISNGIIEELELRKLWEEPFYALFYNLGKLRKMVGDNEKAKAGFRAARRLAPYEPKIYSALMKSWL
jgi:glycosyltransferase involved in cell wall biosynthesis